MKYVSFYLWEKNPISKARIKININPRPNFLPADLNHRACFFKKSREWKQWLCLHDQEGWTMKEKLFDPSFIMITLFFWFLLCHSTLHHVISLPRHSPWHAGRIWISGESLSRIISWFVQNMEVRSVKLGMWGRREGEKQIRGLMGESYNYRN